MYRKYPAIATDVCTHFEKAVLPDQRPVNAFPK